jgi:hypothetical protein
MASKQRQTRIVNRTKTRTRLLLTGSVRRVEKGVRAQIVCNYRRRVLRDATGPEET